jgi:hypothetical protein
MTVITSKLAFRFYGFFLETTKRLCFVKQAIPSATGNEGHNGENHTKSDDVRIKVA